MDSQVLRYSLDSKSFTRIEGDSKEEVDDAFNYVFYRRSHEFLLTQGSCPVELSDSILLLRVSFITSWGFPVALQVAFKTTKPADPHVFQLLIEFSEGSWRPSLDLCVSALIIHRLWWMA
ncbi:hypothetical protein TNIN_486591 [Trichonephila inaurata madagascariensis]|uniref:Uncharacterized protein n=1 Tax=Trichonephila inaurata madagascariensis TaxID=2747483 RepID=A0A8X6YA46_9ARAC|nr:hypothetical protein TNIN_486591 [Trichonephila inaurata madagascariensis]